MGEDGDAGNRVPAGVIDRKCETCRFVEKVTGTQVAVGSVAVEGDTLYCRWGPEKYEVPSADHWCYQWMGRDD